MLFDLKTITTIFISFVTSSVAGSFKTYTYAALGDSYAAGDGAGSSRLLPHWDLACGRFSEAYPYQIQRNQKLDIAQAWPGFEFKACGGATTITMRLDQRLSRGEKDLITIQVGGNEVDFFPILNECIVQWHPLSTCDRELNRARALIKDRTFRERYGAMIRDIVKHSDYWNSDIFVLGYAKFFNADTVQCDGVSFSLTNPVNVLSRKLRSEFNELVEELNDVIKRSAEYHGATYIDIDHLFEGHRFCEENVIEPHVDWNQTWFFRETPQQESGMLFSSTTQKVLPSLHESDLEDDQRQQILINSSPFKRFADLTRTFHPTIKGHAAIAKEVVDRFDSLLLP